MKPEQSARRDDKAAASAARPRDFEYSDSQRDADYYAFLDAQARCPECQEGYMQDYSDGYSDSEDCKVCPVCGYAEYDD